MRKRLLSLILILILLLTVLAGCAGNSEPSAAGDTGQTVSQVDTGGGETELPTNTETGSETTAAEETAYTATTGPETEESKPSEETTKPETKPTEPSVSTTPKEETTTPPTQTENTETTEPPTQATEEPEESQPPVQTQPPETTEPPVTTQPPEVSEPEPDTFTEADHNRIVSEVKAYAESYAAKGFTFQWKESMTFGWDVGYMGTPRIERDGVDGVIDLLKYHVDLIYKTSTDPAYGVTTTVMTYKVEQITIDGDLAYVVIYGG